MHSNQTQSTPVKSENSEANPHPISNESPAEKMERREGGRVSSKDLREGDVFGRWTLVSKVLRLNNQGHNRSWWNCRCACGSERCVAACHIPNGASKSCGCLSREITSRCNTSHGESKGSRTPEYRTWQDVRKRVFNKNSKAYPSYGGRGISLCSGWAQSFESFLLDMGRKPSESHSIERIDNDGNYSCGHCPECVANEWVANCKWATRLEQARNKRSSLIIDYNGESKTLAEWARDFDINYLTLYGRVITRKMPIGEALDKITNPASGFRER